jgi:hypothetical protein
MRQRADLVEELFPWANHGGGAEELAPRRDRGGAARHSTKKKPASGRKKPLQT